MALEHGDLDVFTRAEGRDQIVELKDEPYIAGAVMVEVRLGA